MSDAWQVAPGGLTAMRTDFCGGLRSADIGRSVALTGWVGRRREHGEHLAYVDLAYFRGDPALAE